MEEVVRSLIEVNGAFGIAEEPFILTSGRASPYYVDLRVIPSSPKHYSAIIEECLKQVMERGGEFDKIVSTEATGLLFGAPVALRCGKGFVWVRKEKKLYGKRKLLEGNLAPGEVVIGLDDLATTGETCARSICAVREEGGEIRKYFVVFDRKEGAQQLLKELSVELISLARMDFEFIKALRESEKFSDLQLKTLEDYVRDPLAWSFRWGREHPEWIKKILCSSVVNGKLVSDKIVIYLTRIHPELGEIYSDRIKDWLTEAGLREAIPELGYKA